MKTLTFQIIDAEYAQLVAMADVLNMTVEEFLYRDGINFITESMGGCVAENLAARIWDTLEEAQRATVKADALDESSYDWHIYRQPDGRFLVDTSGKHIADAEAQGMVLVLHGLSVDWEDSVPA